MARRLSKKPKKLAKRPPSNADVISILREIGEYLAMRDVAFKPQAYERAASTIETLWTNVSDVYREGGVQALNDLPGIGHHIAAKIEELLTTGSLRYYKKLKKAMPVNLEALVGIEGVGPKTVRRLWEKLGVRTVSELEKAARAGKVRVLEGFGVKSEEKILRGISFLKRDGEKHLLGGVTADVRAIVGHLRNHKATHAVEVAGSIRRYQETVGDADILIATDSPEEATGLFVDMSEVDRVLLRGKTKSRVRLHSGLEVDLRVVQRDQFGSALQYFTGDKRHNVALREFARERGYKLNEYGLFKGRRRAAGETEKEVYAALGFLQVPPPEVRTNTGEIEAALNGKMPILVEHRDIRGDLQVQTNWTDGKHSVQEMAEAARERGYEYIAITDHTVSLAMTGGLNARRLRAQMREIDDYNRSHRGITVLKGSEVDILKDGSLDLPDDVLDELDIVGVAVHSHFSMSEVEMTERIVRALHNPRVDMLFHPTGRLLKRRDAYAVDMDRLIAVAKEERVALEVNAFPSRLDLRDVDVRKAVEAGVKLAIDTDAHHKEHLAYMEFGVGQARRGWARKNDVINTMPLSALTRWLKTHRKRKKQGPPRAL